MKEHHFLLFPITPALLIASVAPLRALVGSSRRERAEKTRVSSLRRRDIERPSEQAGREEEAGAEDEGW